jgi:hypothetical protein
MYNFRKNSESKISNFCAMEGEINMTEPSVNEVLGRGPNTFAEIFLLFMGFST